MTEERQRAEGRGQKVLENNFFPLPQGFKPLNSFMKNQENMYFEPRVQQEILRPY
jgi:hypothetical protein